MDYSACIEWLFAEEASSFGDRIRLARAAGFTQVEFWRWSDKDLSEVAAALRETGVRLAAILAEPKAQIVNPATHGEFLEGLRKSADVAAGLGASLLIVQSGDRVPGASQKDQSEALAEVLSRAAPIAHARGLTLALEPLNTALERPDYFLSSTREGLLVIDAVGHPSCKLLYDLYHSAMMAEDVVEVLGDRIDAVAHVHLADVPGRGAPGTGGAPWRRWLRRLEEKGYSGAIGLEYRPEGLTADSLPDLPPASAATVQASRRPAR